MSAHSVARGHVAATRFPRATLREREALLLDLAASIPGAMFRLMHRAPGTWQFVYLSPGVEALFEVTPAQACGDHTALLGCILQADRPAHDASVRAAVARSGPWEHEYRIRTGSGLVKWVHARARPTRTADRNVVWTGVFTDISDRKRIEAGLRASEATYRTLFETVAEGVVYQDRSGRITSANPAALRILGLTMDQMQGRTSLDPCWQAIHEDGTNFPGEEHPPMETLRTGFPVSGVVMGVWVPDRGYTWLMVNSMPVFTNDQVAAVYSSFEDITRQVVLTQELRRQATTDFLTGAANRRSLMESLEAEFERIRRHPELCCGILALDLDHFKRVNDTWDHTVGDAVLVRVTQLIRTETRLHDIVGRSGGEEFTLLLPDTDAAAAVALAERLRRRVEHTPTVHEGQPIAITVSIGVSVMSAADVSTDDMLARADDALYEAKHSGRNAVRLR